MKVEMDCLGQLSEASELGSFSKIMEQIERFVQIYYKKYLSNPKLQKEMLNWLPFLPRSEPTAAWPLRMFFTKKAVLDLAGHPQSLSLNWTSLTNY